MPLFRPTHTRDRVTDLTPQELKNWGIHGVLLDVDNTLTTHHGMRPLPLLAGWIAAMRAAGIKLMIASNSHEDRVKPFADLLGVEYQPGCKKPLPFGLKRAIGRMNLPKNRVLLVGDQIFTDILGGCFLGIATVLVRPIEPEPGRAFRFKRFLERPFSRRAYRLTKNGGKRA